MIHCTTITVKIKASKTIKSWYSEQAKIASTLYNQCLDLQFALACQGQSIYTAFDLANYFRSYSLGSDYKDRIFERVADSTKRWLQSESFRYELYWFHKNEKRQYAYQEEYQYLENYPYITDVLKKTEQRDDYKKHVQRLARKQKICGKPRKRKTCSLAFSIRKNRQLTVEEDLLIVGQKLNAEKILVGVDMGLKTTRTAVAVSESTKEIIEVYQPERQRFFEQSYNALVWASTKDKRHLPFVHRKIARRRRDSIDKDSVKILAMGDIFKFGKPNAAFLLSGRLARSAADAANSLFLTRFAKRAARAGKEAGEVNESYTSVTCRKCSMRRKMPLHLRTFECQYCDHVEDRDQHSAYQIAFRNFLNDEDIQGKQQKKKAKNGQLSGREMKLVVIPQGDFQAQAALQARP